jgi:hypothetical protein
VRKAIPVQPDGSIVLPRDLTEEVFGKARQVVVHVRSGYVVLSPVYVDMESGSIPDLLKSFHESESLRTVLKAHFDRSESDSVQFEGDLSVLSLSDVFLFLSASKKTGVLFLEGATRWGFFFDNGNLVYAASDEPRSGLAAHLLAKQFITEQDLVQNLERLNEGANALTVLSEASGLDGKELLDQRIRLVESAVFHVFTFDSGRFGFRNGTVAAPFRLALPMTTTNYVMEATRRVDEWARLKDRVPDSGTVLEIVEDVTASTKLSYEEEQVLAQVVNGRAMEEVIVKAKVGDMEGKKAIVSLIAAGLLKPVRSEVRGAAEPSPAPTLDEAEHRALMARLERYNSVFSTIYQALSVEVGGKVDVILGAFFKGLEPGGSVLAGLDFTSEGVLAEDAVLERLARLPGDREAVLVKDLNELLYFQLFAVKNSLGPDMEAGVVEMAKNLLNA